jgi:alpha-mannosidase
VTGLFGKGWDHLSTLDQQVVELAKERSTPERRIIVSNQEDFFRDFEKTHGKDLPEFSAAFGNEWDLYIASVSELSARVKRSVEKLRTAEALAAMVAVKRPDFLNGREGARDLAFLNLGLFWEHGWTADGPILRSARAEWGRRIAAGVESYVDGLESDAAAALGALIPNSGAYPRFYVFNPLGWERTDYADFAWDGAGDVHVVDAATGRETPSQTVLLDWHVFGKGRRYLRVLAERIPPVGYRVFEVRPGKGAAASEPAATWRNGVFESALYRLRATPYGALTSLVDKAHGERELARTADGHAINDIGPGEGSITLENSGPVSATLRIDVKGPLARTTRITLSRANGRVDLRNEITENFADLRSWKFSFNVDAPDVWHEEVGAVIRARLTTDGGHYSPVHSRLDWLSLNHFAAISGRDGRGVTLSSPDLSFMRLGDSAVVEGVSKLDTATPRLSVLAGGQVDGPKLGVPAQGGDQYFLQRFALVPYTAYRAAESMRAALEHQNPLLAAPVTGGRGYPEFAYSFAALNDPDALLWALKPAEDGIGAGVIARVWNLSDAVKELTMTVAGSAKSTQVVTHIETPAGQTAAPTQSVKPRQMLTLLVK